MDSDVTLLVPSLNNTETEKSIIVFWFHMLLTFAMDRMERIIIPPKIQKCMYVPKCVLIFVSL